MSRGAVLVACLVLACGDAGQEVVDAGATRLTLTPGQGVGDVELGMRYGEVRELLGEPASPSLQNRIAQVRYRDLGLELVVTSPSALELDGDARVIAVGARAADGVVFEGTPRPGQSRAAIENELGPAPEVIGDIHYYESGVTVEYDGEMAAAIGIVPAYELAPEPPPMQPAGGGGA